MTLLLQLIAAAGLIAAMILLRVIAQRAVNRQNLKSRLAGGGDAACDHSHASCFGGCKPPEPDH